VSAAQIRKATLTLFLDHVNAGGSINVDAVSASTPWGELRVSGNSGISPGTAVNTSVMTNTADTFIALDTTAAVQGWITTPGSNNGFMIQASTGTSVQFDSKENTSTSHPATLTIVLASSGPMGATGPAGAASTVAGPADPTGAAGAIGNVASALGYVYNLSAQTVPVEHDVNFGSIGSLSGIIHPADANYIIAIEAGVYSVTFSVIAAQASQFTLVYDGIPVAGTTYGSGLGTAQYTGQAILALNAGDLVGLRNHSSAAAVTLPSLTGGTQVNVNASMLIVRLQ
jgi:BclA C-terminal domain